LQAMTFIMGIFTGHYILRSNPFHLLRNVKYTELLKKCLTARRYG
jgi:hypothetical protein